MILVTEGEQQWSCELSTSAGKAHSWVTGEDGKHVNLSLVQCYAPTNDSDDTTKDSFYAQLQAELEKLPRHDMLVIMVDLNAKVGSDNSSYDRAMGKEGCGTMNENGERLAELCAAYNLVIGGTIFPSTP
ncbi:hypothetical protein ACROYT_G022409 [Oculina patagonica]